MEFRSGAELLALCRQENCPISRVMRRREWELGEESPERVLYLWLQGTVGQAFLSSQGYLEAEE